MININWNKAPEGTTHADCESNFYKIELVEGSRTTNLWDKASDAWETTQRTVQELFELNPIRDYLWYDRGTVMMYPCKGEQFLWKNQVATTLAVTSEGHLVFESEGMVGTITPLSMEYIQPMPTPAVLAAQEEKATNKKLFDKITKDVIRGKRDLGKTPDQIFDELYNEGYRISKLEQ